MIQTESVKNLWIGSLMLGLAYGGMFGLFPVIAIEWFGLGELDLENGMMMIFSSLFFFGGDSSFF